MNKDMGLFLLGILLLILLCFLPNYSLYDYLKEVRSKSYDEKRDKGVFVVCKACKGSGETEQDVNLLMSQASFAIWHNSHINSKDRCNICSNNKVCEIAQKKYNEIMNDYKKIGPKIEMANCPGCMGAGSYTQYKGYRVGRERN